MRNVLMVGIAGCSGAFPGPGFGTTDADRDQWAIADGDCDDTDPDVSPSALDWPDDDVDQDCDGDDADALPLAAVEPGDLVVTEVMSDPVGVDGAYGEWFEVHNTRDVPIDLEELAARDAGSDDFEVGRSLVIAAGGFLVFGASDDPVRSGGVPVDFVYEGDFGLSNNEDQIRLEVDGSTIDSVSWDPDYPLVSGHTMSLDPAADADTNDTPDPWCLADPTAIFGVSGRGSPGAENPPCPPPFHGLRVAELVEGDLVISEILKDPLAVDGDYGEWFELYNGSGEDVDLVGLVVEDDSGDDFEVFRPLVVEAGGYVVFGSFLDEAKNGRVPVDAEWRWGFSLANSGDTIRVLAGTRVIDTVAYDPGLTFPDTQGSAMALDPDALDAVTNDDGSRWCVATRAYGLGDLGTPGAQNDGCP